MLNKSVNITDKIKMSDTSRKPYLGDDQNSPGICHTKDFTYAVGAAPALADDDEDFVSAAELESSLIMKSDVSGHIGVRFISELE